jgi:tetratricopeptide (TPR) repeat protein
VGVRVAAAQSTEAKATIAVVGVHGNGEQSLDALADIHAALVRGLRDGDRFVVVTGDEVRSRLEPKRGDILGKAYLGPARQAFEEGRVLYNQARPDEALEALDRATEALRDNEEFLRDQRLVVEIALHRGLTFEIRGDEDRAREAYTDVVRMAPDRVLDSLDYPPSTVALFDQARRKLLDLGGGTLDLELDPTSTGSGPARIYLDGRLVGAAPAGLPRVPPGEHFVVLERDGGHRWFGRVEISSGETAQRTVVLRQRGLARLGEGIQSERSGATRRLYRAIAEAAATDLVVVAGFDEAGDFRLSLLSRGANTFSLALTASLAAGPGARSAFVRQLVERISRYAERNGIIIAEKVDAKVIPIILGANPTLNEYLFVIPRADIPVVTTSTGGEVEPTRTGPPPGAILAIVLGILGGSGAAAAVYLGTNPPTGPAGTITVTVP